MKEPEIGEHWLTEWEMPNSHNDHHSIVKIVGEDYGRGYPIKFLFSNGNARITEKAVRIPRTALKSKMTDYRNAEQ